jgi:hypothetical protein
MGKSTREFVLAMGAVRRNDIGIFQKKEIVDRFSDCCTLDLVQQSRQKFERKNLRLLAESCSEALLSFDKLRREVLAEGLLSIRSDKE